MTAAQTARPSTGRRYRSPRMLPYLLALGCVALALAGCSKGREAAPEASAAASASAEPAGLPTYDVSVSKFTYQGMPESVPSGKPFRIVFSNTEAFDITHELVVLAIPSGKTLDDIIADAKAKGQDGEDDWLHFGEIADVDTGGTGVGTFQLPPGDYAITCWEDGKAGGGTGPVHASIGMAKAFTVS